MANLVVVLPLDPLQEGESFAVKSWPLHITVLPPFKTDAAPSEIADAIAAATSRQQALTAIAGHDEMFGRREDVPVTVIEENSALTQLHRDLVDALKPFAARPDERAFTGRGFRAHVTIKGPRRVRKGDELALTQIALVDMAPRSAPGGRVVLATVRLPVGG
jgi:2'-5' RNA ligase